MVVAIVKWLLLHCLSGAMAAIAFTRLAYMNIEALRAAPPEALTHSPSQMPLSCPVAPLSQCELHKDGCGGGGGVARRARAARAPKARSYATSFGTSSGTSCAASFTCSSFMCHLRAGAGGGSRPGRRAPVHPFFFAPKKLQSDEDDQDGHFFFNHPERGDYPAA